MTIKRITNKLIIKNFLTLLCFIAVPVIILSVLSYSNGRDVYVNSLNENTRQVTSQAKIFFDMGWHKILSFSETFFYRNLQEYRLSEIDESNLYTYTSQSTLAMANDDMSRMVAADMFFDYVDFYNEDVHLSSTVGLVKGPFILKRWSEAFAYMKSANIDVHTLSYSTPNNTSELAVMTAVRDDKDNIIGALIYHFDSQLIKDLSNISSDVGNTNLIITDSDKNILYSQNPDGQNLGYVLNETSMNLSDHVHLDSQLSDFNYWTYNIYGEYDLSYASFNRSLLLIVLLILVCIVISLLGAFMFTVKTYAPIVNIFNMILGIENKMYFKTNPKTNDDYYHISKIIVNNYVKMQQLEKNALENEIELKQAQYIAMQAQINPHFLFNTLEHIKWWAMDLTRSENTASTMITKLSEILKYSVVRYDTPVTLRDEITMVKNYIYLMQERYRDKLNVDFDVEEAAFECYVPKLLIQPLMENCLTHGVRVDGSVLKIRVKVKLRNSYLVVKIIDNGAGVDQQKMSMINNNLLKGISEDRSFEHVGLFNVKKRLDINNGTDYSNIKFKSKKNVGTVVEILVKVTDK